MLSRKPDNKTDIPGYEHNLKNNVGLFSKNGNEIININLSECSLENNNFNSESSKEKIMGVFDKEKFFNPRKENGDLPDLNIKGLRN